MATAPSVSRHPLIPTSPPARTDPAPALPETLLAADSEAMVLRTLQERLLTPLARAAAEFRDQTGWQAFGYARIEDHARERFHRSGRWVRDLAALHTTMQNLPAVGAALTGVDGGAPIGMKAALLIGRVATPESAPAWVDAARRLPVRRLREQVRAASERDSPWPPQPTGNTAHPGGNRPHGDGDISSPSERTPAEHARASNDHTDRRPADDDPTDPDPAARVLVQFPIPLPAQALFDEALDLFRAVEGREAASVTEFVEALVAEACAGPAPPDIELAPLPRRRTEGPEVENALAEATGNWRHLKPPRVAAGDASPSASGDPERGDNAPAVDVPPVDVPPVDDAAHARALLHDVTADPDARIRRLLLAQDELERRLGRLLARMTDEGAWSRLGFTGLAHYAEQRLGLSRSSAQDRAHLARALRRLALLRAAYESGRVGFRAALSVVRTLGHRQLSPEVEAAWVARAARATVKRLDDEARALKRIEAGLDGRAAAKPAPRPLDDAAWSASLVRRVGTARRRLAEFRRLAFQGDARPTLFRLRLPEELAASFLGAIESARRRIAADPTRMSSIGTDATDPTRMSSTGPAGPHTLARTVPSWVGLVALLEDFILTWDANQSYRRPGAEAIYARDGWRCRAPGCTGRRNLEKHHIRYRSRLGSDEHSNLVCLCRLHHQLGEHGDLARVTGEAPLGLLWSLGRGGRGGQFRNELRLEAAGHPPGAQP